MAHILIAPTTDVVDSPRAFLVNHSRLPCTLMAVGLGPDEEVAVTFSPDNGVTWESLMRSGAQVILTHQNNVASIEAPIVLGVTKTATVNPVGVYVSAADNL